MNLITTTIVCLVTVKNAIVCGEGNSIHATVLSVQIAKTSRPLPIHS